MADEQPRAFPDMRRNRRLFEQKVLRDGVKKPALGVPDHIAVDTAAGVRRGEAVAGQNLTIGIMHDDPAAGRGVVLVVFHTQSFGQVPLVVDDEQFTPGAKHVREKFAVVVDVGKRQRCGLHRVLLQGGYWSRALQEAVVR